MRQVPGQFADLSGEAREEASVRCPDPIAALLEQKAAQDPGNDAWPLAEAGFADPPGSPLSGEAPFGPRSRIARRPEP